MSEPSSLTSRTPSAFFDPESLCWRTSQGSLLSEVPPLLDRLPPWGTTHGGVLFELPIAELLIGVRDGSALLGTPTRDNAVRSERFRSKNPNPGELVKLLATPRAALADARNTKPWVRPMGEPQNLENNVARLLPTPVVNDMGAGKTPEEWDSWRAEMASRHGNGNGHGASLSVEAARLLPTPRAALEDSRNNRPFGRERDMSLLPTPTANDCKVFGPNIDWKKRAEHQTALPSILMNMENNDA